MADPHQPWGLFICKEDGALAEQMAASDSRYRATLPCTESAFDDLSSQRDVT